MLVFGMVARDGKEQYLAFENIGGLVKVQDAGLKPSNVTKCGGGRTAFAGSSPGIKCWNT